MSGMMAGSGVVLSMVSGKGRICGRTYGRDVVRSRVLFVVSFWWGGDVCVSV